LVALLLFVMGQRGDVCLGQYIARLEEWVSLCHFALDGLRLALAIPLGGKTVGSNAVSYQIVYHTLRPLLRQPGVVCIRTFVVGMGREFYRHVGVLVEQSDEFVEGGGRLRTKGGLVKVVEDVFYQYRSRDVGKRKLEYVFLRRGDGFYTDMFLMIQVALAGTQ
jgi:hypothetical protein